jgi:hypothetical protein
MVVYDRCTSGCEVVVKWCTDGCQVVHEWCIGGVRVVHAFWGFMVSLPGIGLVRTRRIDGVKLRNEDGRYWDVDMILSGTNLSYINIDSAKHGKEITGRLY